MTDIPPPPAEDDLTLDDDLDEDVAEEEDLGEPDVLAVVAFALSLCSLFAFGVMNGITYVVPFINGQEDNSNKVVVGTVVGAALALIPVWLGWRAESRVLDSDPRWVGTLARAAIVIGLVSGGLRLVIAVLAAAHDGSTGFTRL